MTERFDNILKEAEGKVSNYHGFTNNFNCHSLC